MGSVAGPGVGAAVGVSTRDAVAVATGVTVADGNGGLGSGVGGGAVGAGVGDSMGTGCVGVAAPPGGRPHPATTAPPRRAPRRTTWNHDFSAGILIFANYAG